MSDYAVTTAGAKFEFYTDSPMWNNCFAIDGNHFINFWMGAGSDGFVQTFAINTSTWAITTANSILEFDTQAAAYPNCFSVDSNHFITFYQGFAADGYAQTFAVNTSTWAVTTANSKLEFDTDHNAFNSCDQIDDNHFINFWMGAGSDGFAQVFEVSTSTWAITTAAAKLEFDTDSALYNSCALLDDNHVINFWRGKDWDGFCQVFEVNTTTWATTAKGSSLEFETTRNGFNACCKIDDNHAINWWTNQDDAKSFVQVFEMNTSTFAVTTAAASIEFDAGGGETTCYKIDANHFIAFWEGVGGSNSQSFEVNTTTWAVTTTATKLIFSTSVSIVSSCFKVDTSHFINFWRNIIGDQYGITQIFEVDVTAAPSGPANLKSWNGLAKASIKSINGINISSVKSINGLE